MFLLVQIARSSNAACHGLWRIVTACLAIAGLAASVGQADTIGGLEFHHPSIAERVEQLESGDAKSAIEAMRKALNAVWAGDPEFNELRVGLALLELRAGKIEAARQTLGTLNRVADGSDVAPRAGVLLAIVTGYPHARRGRGPGLQSQETWSAAMHWAAGDRSRTLVREDQKLIRACAAGRWAAIPKLVEEATRVIEQLHAIQLADSRDALHQITEGHAGRLAEAAAAANRSIKQIEDDMNGIQMTEVHQTVKNSAGVWQGETERTKNGRRWRGGRQGGSKQVKWTGWAPPEAVNQYNALCAQITRGLEAVDAVIEEYHAFAKRHELPVDESVQRAIPTAPLARNHAQ